MKLQRATIENYRAIERLELPLHSQLTVLHGDNGHGKTSVLSAIAVGLGGITWLLPEVSSNGFLKSDQRGLRPQLIELKTTDGLVWERRKGFGRKPGGVCYDLDPALVRFSSGIRAGMQHLRSAVAEILSADLGGRPPLDLPIVAFYDTDRAVLDVPQRRRGGKREYSRYDALEGALSVRSNFRDFFNWFDAKENEELRQKRDRRDFDYQIKELGAVRRAIEAMVPGVSRPRTTHSPTRFVVSVASENGDGETELEISQLSGGYRIALALAADLARRMAQGNPHLDDPLQSEAIALIDEVDLHLHPSWQQRVLPDLMRTFPNAQFIVSTHSPQVLTTVKPEHIVRLRRHGDGIIATGTRGPTYGAEAGYALAVEMGVKERPPAEHNEFVALLEQYNHLVYYGQGKSDEALQLRRKLESISPRDFALSSADSEMRRQQVMAKLGRKP